LAERALEKFEAQPKLAAPDQADAGELLDGAKQKLLERNR
jgi:hypothetical protein